MARLFDASNNDYIEVGDVPALDLTGDQVTLAVRARLASTNGEKKVLAKWSDSPLQHQYLLSINSDEKVMFAVNAGGVSLTTGTTTLVTDTWYHLAGTYDGSDIRVYLDGVEENSASVTGNMPNTSAPVRIGAGSGGAGTENPFDGDIGHCAIWDVGLSAGEIASLAAGMSPLSLHKNFPLFYAPLNGRTPEYDVIGGLDLTVNGPVKSPEPPGQYRPIVAP